MEVGAVGVRYFVQARKNRRVVFRAEHDKIDFVGRKLVARNLVRKQRIARIDKAFREPPQKPLGIKLHSVRPRAGVQNHFSLPNASVECGIHC